MLLSRQSKMQSVHDSNNFEKDVENNIFDYKFLFYYYTKLCKELIQLFTTKKNVLNASRESTNSVVVTGTRTNIGAYYSRKAFATTKRYKLIGLNVKNCLYHPNIKRKPPLI